MSNLLFLAVALVVSVIGSVVLLLRHRQPRSMEATMKDFDRQIRALAPEPPDERRGQPAG